MQPLLSIAIPSNNRTELLDEAIGSILAEPGFESRCEICISDNSSGSGTQELIESKYSGNGKIAYRRSLDSPSLDENVNKVVSIANGQYVWIFGDDDLIVPGFLSHLLEYLQGHSPDILIVNSRSFQGSEIVEESRVSDSAPKVYGAAENDEFLSDLGGYLTYVACIVIRKDLWGQYFQTGLVGSYFAHIDTVCRVKIGRAAHYLPQPGISMRLHYQTWTARHFEIWNNLYPQVIWGLSGYSDIAKQSVIPRYPINSLKRILASRAYGRFNFVIWRTVLVRSSVASSFVKLFGLLIVLLPRQLFRWLYILYIRFGRSKHDRGFSPKLALAQLGRSVK